MIIDIHAHTFPEKIAGKAVDSLSKKAHIVPRSSGTIPGLFQIMEKAGVDISVLVPVATNPGQVVKVNDSAIANNEAFPDRIISFGCIHPEFENYRSELRRLRDNGIKGIKIHPVYQGYDIDDVHFLRIIDCAAENDLIVLTHAGFDVGFPGLDHCSPRMCRNVVDEIGNFVFILAHMGGWEMWDEVPEYLAETEVYLDTSFSSEKIDPLGDGYWDNKSKDMMSADGYTKIIKAFGAQRILFGSDSPWTDQAESISFINRLPIGDEEKKMILGENAKRLLKI